MVSSEPAGHRLVRAQSRLMLPHQLLPARMRRLTSATSQNAARTCRSLPISAVDCGKLQCVRSNLSPTQGSEKATREAGSRRHGRLGPVQVQAGLDARSAGFLAAARTLSRMPVYVVVPGRQVDRDGGAVVLVRRDGAQATDAIDTPPPPGWRASSPSRRTGTSRHYRRCHVSHAISVVTGVWVSM